MSTVITLDEGVVTINQSMLDNLKIAALNDIDKRARYCVHKSDSDIVHEMIIAFTKESTIKPHRHSDKCESYYIIEGELDILIFNDKGVVKSKLLLSTDLSKGAYFCRMPMNMWHTVVPKSKFVIIYEVTNGPFIKDSTEYAQW